MMLPDQILDIAKRLKNGDVTILPTNSLWGISCDAFNKDAVERVAEIKHRAPNHPFVLLVSDIDMLLRYVTNLHPRIETLLSLHSKPLTVIHQALDLPEYLIHDDDTVAIRITQNPLCQQIIHQLDNPIVSTSANVSGNAVPSNFDQIDTAILSELDFTPPFPASITELQLTEPSVIVSYDIDGELDFLRN